MIISNWVSFAKTSEKVAKDPLYLGQTTTRLNLHIGRHLRYFRDIVSQNNNKTGTKEVNTFTCLRIRYRSRVDRIYRWIWECPAQRNLNIYSPPIVLFPWRTYLISCVYVRCLRTKCFIFVTKPVCHGPVNRFKLVYRSGRLLRSAAIL